MASDEWRVAGGNAHHKYVSAGKMPKHAQEWHAAAHNLKAAMTTLSEDDYKLHIAVRACHHKATINIREVILSVPITTSLQVMNLFCVTHYTTTVRTQCRGPSTRLTDATWLRPARAWGAAPGPQRPLLPCIAGSATGSGPAWGTHCTAGRACAPRHARWRKSRGSA